MAFGASELAMIGFASSQFINLQQANATVNKKNMNATFDQVKQIDAGVLNVGYVEDGPADGAVVILLHGWPYDIYSYTDVAPFISFSRLSSNRSIFAWLWYNDFSFQ